MREKTTNKIKKKEDVRVINVDLLLIVLKGILYYIDLLFYVHGKHLRSCRDGQLT